MLVRFPSPDFNHHSTRLPCMIAGFRGDTFRPIVSVARK
jgi:hypothetical protein